MVWSKFTGLQKGVTYIPLVIGRQDWASGPHTLEYGCVDLGTHFAKGIIKIGLPTNSEFSPFQKTSGSPSHISVRGTKASFNSAVFPRPVYYSLSEVSSR